MQSIIESINRDRDRKLLQERLLADARQFTDAQPATPTTAPSEPSAPGAASAASLEDQLENARNTLRDLELRLKPEHPDIVRSERAVRELEAKVAAEELKRPVRKTGPAPAPRLTPAQITQRNRVRELELEIQNLDEQISRKQTEQQRLEGVIATYQRRSAAVPTHESELTELMRDYDTLQKSYVSLLSKKEDSKVAENLERRQIGQQFKILDPAREPETPFSPKRTLLDLVGAAVGLALGLGLTALLEYLDSSLKTEDDVVQALMLPVLALIPLMSAGDERRSRKRRAFVLSCVAAALVLVSAAAAWKLDAIGWVR